MATNPVDFTVDALLCDSAEAVNGKVYVLGGGWNRIQSPKFPFNQQRIAIAAIVGVPYHATNINHTLRAELHRDPGGQAPGDAVEEANEAGRPVAAQVEAQFTVGRPPGILPGERQNIPFAVNLNGIPFDEPGEYSFVLSVNGIELNWLPFRVIGMTGFNLGHTAS